MGSDEVQEGENDRPSSCSRCLTTVAAALLVSASIACGDEECEAGKVRCGASCSTLREDSFNCGACGKECALGEDCDSGECVCRQTRCGVVCVNLDDDDGHCGTCDNACLATAPNCDRGACTRCPAQECLDECVEIDHDFHNCGGCGLQCGEDSVCVRGVCVAQAAFGCDPPCNAELGLLCCPSELGGPDFCAHIEDDDENCGGCGITCRSPGCTAGQCERAEH